MFAGLKLKMEFEFGELDPVVDEVGRGVPLVEGGTGDGSFDAMMGVMCGR